MNCRDRVRLGSTALILLVVAGFGCGRLSAPPIAGGTPATPVPADSTVAPATQPTAAQVAEPVQRAVPVDQSLSLEEYVQLGMPASDRTWTGDDMISAHKILTSLVQKGYGQLPRFKSERSGEVFARMTSSQNLDIYRNRTLPIAARLPPATNYLGASNQIFKLYFAGFLQHEIGGDELIDMMGAQFHSLVVTLDLVDEFWPTVKKDEKYEVRLRGIEQMKQGFTGVVTGGLQTLTERPQYQRNELIRLVGYMDETFPEIFPRLPPGSRTELLLKLEKMQTDPAFQDLQPDLGELYAKVKSAVENSKAPK